MKTNGFKKEDLEGSNMALIMGSAYLLSVVISFFMTSIALHQHSTFSMMFPDILEKGSQAQIDFTELMKTYGMNGRNFGHGFTHGVITSIFFVGPVIGINALFEKRSVKYVLIHLVYWMISLGLIGGVLAATLEYASLL